MVLILAAVTVVNPERDTAWERVQATGVIVFATDATFPPFTALDVDGEYVGFDIDLAREVARRLDLRAEFELSSYDALLASLGVGRADAVVSALVERPDRLHEAHFTRPYFNAGTQLVAAAANGSWPADLARWAQGRTIAVEHGSQGDVIARRWARRVAGLTIARYDTAAATLQSVTDGQAAGALGDSIAVFEFIAADPLAWLHTPAEDVPYVIAVSAASPRLGSELDRVVGEMEADGWLGELRARWFGEAARRLIWMNR